MTTREMQYDIKFKLNKIDSEQYRNLRIPELDWVINEACDIFIKNVAEPRVNSFLGFETSQRTIDDIRTIVIDKLPITPTKLNSKEYLITLPDDYKFYIASEVLLSRDNCSDRYAVEKLVIQHDDKANTDLHSIPSFEWSHVNMYFYDKGIKVFTDGTFNIKNFELSYIKKHPYIHNAQDFLPMKSYKSLEGVSLSGSQNCELPEHTHREIVDIAVLLLTQNMQAADYQLKHEKLKLNQLIN